MRMYDIIEKKRDGFELTDEEIRFFIEGYTDGSIPDYQASALCMAIFFQGMNDREITTLTMAMEKSGDTIDLSDFGTLSADKHSTGGVGDKTSLIVMPTVASLGAKVAKMTGRGLGHTGGTVDKLESIPGYQIALDSNAFLKQVHEIGIALVGQSGNLTPADKKLYALRDVTATVNSIPLITSSIMSKKLAAGAHNIVLDVKVGSGAFMKTPEDAAELATKMVTIGKMCGRKVTAVLSNMDAPLGYNIGNALEAKEAIEALKGRSKGDLYEVCLTLASNLIHSVFDLPLDEARCKVVEAIDNGSAFNTFRTWIKAQGGDVRVIDDPDQFEKAPIAYEIRSSKAGYLSRMDAEEIGLVSVMLGAGREKKEDSIDYSAGIILAKKTGEKVEEGDLLATLYTARENVLKDAERRYLGALSFSDTEPAKAPLISQVIA